MVVFLLKTQSTLVFLFGVVSCSILPCLATIPCAALFIHHETISTPNNTELGNHALWGINMHFYPRTEIGSVPKFRGVTFWACRRR
jgi:hypothetical protein